KGIIKWKGQIQVKKNKRSSQKKPSLQTKPFTNLSKPFFNSFGLLYQLIKRRLNEERIQNERLIEWLLDVNNFNDEQLINMLLLEMLLLEKRLKTLNRQKVTDKALSYEDFIA